jgi:hypothetical protein
VVLMEDSGNPRIRKWDPDIGFLNLFQGRDAAPQPNGDFYPGDQYILNLEDSPNQIVAQVHRNRVRGAETQGEVLSLALYLGGGLIVRRDRNV